MTDRSHRTIDEILDAMEETCTSLEELLEVLEVADWHRPTGCPGWDVQDVVSHIIGLEDQLAGIPDPEHRLAEGVDPPADGDLLRFEIQVDFRRRLPPAEILDQFRRSTKRGLELRRKSERSAEEISEGPFGWKLPYWRLMSIRTFDLFAHEQDIRRALGRPGNLDGKAAALVCDLCSEALPGILPARVDGLATQQVVIEAVQTEGRPGRRIAIGATTRADRDGPDRVDEVTSATIPFDDLLAFACGRSDASAARMTVIGNAELVTQMLSSMGFTP
jgi:uncharacterized protein (TIGR03083 family)